MHQTSGTDTYDCDDWLDQQADLNKNHLTELKSPHEVWDIRDVNTDAKPAGTTLNRLLIEEITE